MPTIIDTAIHNWIGGQTKFDDKVLYAFPWMNERLAEEELMFWLENGVLIKSGNTINYNSNYRRPSIIFLDVDGVLNHSKSNDAIEDECLLNLSDIVKKTNSLIILVSSWKSGWFKKDKLRQDEDANYLDEKLKAVGLTIFDKSSRYASGRTIEVIDWIMKLNALSFAILDDDIGHYTGTALESHLIRTDYYCGGLTSEKAEAAVELLTNIIC